MKPTRFPSLQGTLSAASFEAALEVAPSPTFAVYHLSDVVAWQASIR